MELSDSQRNLISTVEKIGRRGENIIPAGPDETDAFGRRLELASQFVDGSKLKPEVLELIKKLKENDNDIETILRGEVMWYDVRSSVWAENPAVSALLALSYAKVLVERSGKTTGHTINIAVDCYKKHFHSMSAFADTIIRTGICQNGGGVVYWGVQNGGSIRNVSQFERAVTGQNGNWVYGTMSHRPEDYVGAKFGMMGKVFCGPDLRQELYGKLISADYPEIIEVASPEDFIITVGDITDNNIDVVEDLIRARTGSKISRENFLAGMKLGMNMCGSPVGKNLLDMLKAFGADVLAENEELNENFNISNIVDPNEHESVEADRLKQLADKNGRIYLAVDPDGDRGTFVAQNLAKKAVSLNGTELLLLAMENLATYNPKNLPNDIIFDMRTGVSAVKFSLALVNAGFKSKTIAAEPGYPFFMELMGKYRTAAIAVENTCHPFLTAFTNPIWGAPKYFAKVQGGDDAAIFLAYLLALSNLVWDGRNPVEQLEFIQKKYGILQTIIKEFKPSVDKTDALRKYDIAKKMSEIAEKELSTKGFIIDTMNSGVRISTSENDAMVLVRYSNTGPSFTASSEAITPENSEKLLKIGAAVMNLAIDMVRQEKGDFGFDWKDYSVYGDISTDEAKKIINEA